MCGFEVVCILHLLGFEHFFGSASQECRVNDDLRYSEYIIRRMIAGNFIWSEFEWHVGIVTKRYSTLIYGGVSIYRRK